jgi:hypothetical protein
MNISDMHVTFRQLAQQMGMQNVLAIRPEQIDALLNTSISDIVNQLVREHVGLKKEPNGLTNGKINQVNELRTLYEVHDININGTGEMLTKEIATALDSGSNPPYLFLIDFAVKYNDVSGVFPIRVIESSELANTLNDAILKPKKTSPVMVISTCEVQRNSQTIRDDKAEIYFGRKVTNPIVRISYIRKPAEVSSATSSVDCDLPETLHVDIVKHAVDLYNISVKGGLYNQQTNQAPQAPARNQEASGQ